MPHAPPELKVIETTQELLVWPLKHIEKFPRTRRYGLGLRLEQRLSAIWDRLIEAKQPEVSVCASGFNEWIFRRELPNVDASNQESADLKPEARLVAGLLFSRNR